MSRLRCTSCAAALAFELRRVSDAAAWRALHRAAAGEVPKLCNGLVARLAEASCPMSAFAYGGQRAHPHAMPIQIDQERARGMAPRFDEAMDLIASEFTGLDPHQQYRSAFARLLKWDPLGRVLMLGTDQRDLFVPELRRAIVDFVPAAGTVFDFGCGDGQTLALAADALPGGARLCFHDPNPQDVARYRRVLESRPHLPVGAPGPAPPPAPGESGGG